MELAQFNL